MNQSYPVPLPELVEQWRATPEYTDLSEKLFLVTLTTKKLQDIATAAAQWGADQELEACCEWIPEYCPWDADQLRAARRPNPPSWKEQALGALGRFSSNAHTRADEMTQDFDTIRRALEALDD